MPNSPTVTGPAALPGVLTHVRVLEAPLLSFDLDRTYPAPPEKVWNALTHADRLQRRLGPRPAGGRSLSPASAATGSSPP